MTEYWDAEYDSNDPVTRARGMKAKIRSMTAENKDLKYENEVLRSENDDLKAEIGGFITENSELKHEIRGLEDESNELKGDFPYGGADSEADTIVRLEDKLKDLQSLYTGLEKDYAELASEHEKLMDEIVSDMV